MANKKKNKKLKNVAKKTANNRKPEELETEFITETPYGKNEDVQESPNLNDITNIQPIEYNESQLVEKESISDEQVAVNTVPEKKIDTNSSQYLIRLVVVLSCICAGIALLLSVVNSITEDIIAENQVKAKQEAILAVFPKGDMVEEYTLDSGDTVYIVLNNNEIIGYTVNAEASGYMGPVEMMIGMTSDGAVDGIKIVSTGETPGVGTKIGAESFLSQFYGFDRTVELGNDVDAISGATFSSRAVEEAVNYAVSLEVNLAKIASNIGANFVGASNTFDNVDANDDNGDAQIEIGEAVGEGDETSVETLPVESEITEIEPIETSEDTEYVETEPIEITPIETEPVETEIPVVIEPVIPDESETTVETWWQVIETETEVEPQPIIETETEVETTVESETELLPETDSSETVEENESSVTTDETVEHVDTDENEPEEIEPIESEPIESVEVPGESETETELESETEIESETEPEIEETAPETEESKETESEESESRKPSFVW